VTQSAGTTWEITIATLTITTGGVITLTDARVYCHINAKVASAAIDDSAVTAAKLATDAVTTVKITDANVTAAKLAANSVATANIIDANVTAAKLAAGLAIPSGMIAIFDAACPNGWTRVTAFDSKFLYGGAAYGATGGAATHTHTGPSHAHAPSGGHQHELGELYCT
jgi:hypothetical protein